MSTARGQPQSVDKGRRRTIQARHPPPLILHQYPGNASRQGREDISRALQCRDLEFIHLKRIAPWGNILMMAQDPLQTRLAV